MELASMELPNLTVRFPANNLRMLPSRAMDIGAGLNSVHDYNQPSVVDFVGDSKVSSAG